MQSNASGTPWLEFFPHQGGPVQKSLLATFPFSIGRNDTTDLPINSTRVSREHAAIVRAGDTYRIRDLDSTNGTFVNGQRIEEATLSDGDIVLIADVEFTFFSGQAQAPRKTVTQVIGFREAEGDSPKTLDVVRSLRRLQETILQSSQCATRRPVIELLNNKTVGFEAVPRAPQIARDSAETDRPVLAAHTRLSTRLRELFYLLAADWLSEGRDIKLFLPLETSDLEPGVVERYVDLVAETAPDLSAVVFEFPDSAVNDIAYFQELYGRLKARNVRICYADFAAGKAQLEVHRKMPPDYLKLARSLARGVLQEAARQTQLQAMLTECRKSGAEIIAPEVESTREAQVFSRVGCRYAIGAIAAEKTPAPAPKPDIVNPLPAKRALAAAAAGE
jgi:EAL domain-containing protein (putative c-di-GMP-specific phosphodiesterase class I)